MKTHTLSGLHCSNCGSTDVEDLTTGDQGYTACCNEPTCDGHGYINYGIPGNFVRGCCIAATDAEWERQEALGFPCPADASQMGY